MSACPECKQFYTNDIICDNSCSTFICGNCKCEYYIKLIGTKYRVIIGHDPKCGEDTSDEENISENDTTISFI